MHQILVATGICLGLLTTNAFGLIADTGYKIETIAGSNWVGDNGPATLAILAQAEGIAADSAGNLYVADAGNHRIRKITRAGVISTLAGTGVAGFSGDGGPAIAAQVNSPYGLASDGAGNLYVADLGNARIRRIGTDGNITTIAGGGSLTPGPSSEGSAATMIALSAPRNVVLDGYEALYFSDFSGHRVYRVDGQGTLTTVAGSGSPGVLGENGPATRAQLAYPTGLAFDRHGGLYIADSQNHLIRKVAGGIISSFARAATPTGMVIDGFGTLYAADPAAGQLLAIPSNGTATALAVSALDLAFGADGYLYATQGVALIRVSFSGASTIVAGGGNLASGDHGSATSALLNHPSGVAVDALGNVYMADRDNNRIRKITVDGTITTFAGSAATAGSASSGDGDNGPGFQAQLSSPSCVTLDANGNLLIADMGHHRIRRVTPAGTILPVPFPGLQTPVYALADKGGNIYVADTGLGAILKMSPLGEVSTLADHLGSPGGFTFDSNGNLYFTETAAKRVRKLDALGVLTTLADGTWNAPTAVVAGTNGDLLVADGGLERIMHIDSSGHVTVVAGTGSAGLSGDGGDAVAAELNGPSAIAIDPAGAIYIADLNNNRIRRLTAEPTAVISPLQVITVVNAASLQPGPIAPGMLLDVLGTGLTAADANNIQVLFQTDSQVALPGQILSIDPSQVELLVPPQLIGADSVQIQIVNKTVLVAQISGVMAASAPGLFADPSGQAIATNEDGTLNSSTNPALRGSIVVFYGTGEGISGQAVSVSVGGYASDVLYAGPVAGYPGLLQVNARMPAGYIGTGSMSVTVTIGLSSSQPGVVVNLN